nr:PREDICTED: RNA-binding protein 41 [Lepisosteus oculatus]
MAPGDGRQQCVRDRQHVGQDAVQGVLDCGATRRSSVRRRSRIAAGSNWCSDTLCHTLLSLPLPPPCSVSRRSCEDAPAPEEQETEGQRQLRGLLLQQLDTAVDLDRCVAKRKCFAPAALYKPFGEQAAGVRSLSEFQALQDGEQELASLRELGLTDAEIELWLSRDALRNAEKVEIWVNISLPVLFKVELLSLFSPLSHFRTNLCLIIPYTSKVLFWTLSKRFTGNGDPGDIHSSDQSQSGSAGSGQSQRENTTSDQSGPQGSRGLPVSRSLSVSQPIGKLCGVGGGPPVTVTGPVQPILEEEIRANRATVQEIQQIPRFRNYQQGEPSKVLFVRNLSPRASLAQLVSVFSRFQPPRAPVLRYRLLTGRLKGQAFITFPDAATAREALELANGFRLLDRPLVIEFGREREEERGAGAPAELGAGSG